MKQEKLYVPKRLLKEIQESDYKRKDDLYLILDGLYRRQIYVSHKFYKEYNYVYLSKQYLSRFIKKDNNISKAKRYLIENGYIKENPVYVPGVFSKSYKITKEWLEPTQMVIVKDKTISKELNSFRLEMRKGVVKNNEETKKKYFKEFSIRYDEAIAATEEVALEALYSTCIANNINIKKEDLLNIINDKIDVRLQAIKDRLTKLKEFYNVTHRLMTHQMVVRAIRDGFLYFRRNKTNGRLDSNLSNLPSYLRKYINSDFELYNLDIKNSQPFFFYCTIKHDSDINIDELNKYKELVINGNLYNYIADEFNNKFITNKPKDRNDGKDMMFKILFSKTTSYSKYKELFADNFPTIMDYINKTNHYAHNTIANMMTIKESTVILDVVKPKLTKLGIEPYTIHDSFIAKDIEINIIENVLLSTCEEMFGVKPSLDKQSLFDSSDEVNEFEDDLIDEDLETFLSLI